MADAGRLCRSEDYPYSVWESHVRFGSEPDISQRSVDVRFTPESGHSSPPSRCQLWAI